MLPLRLPLNTLTEQKRAELRDNILNLAMTCPMDHCNPTDCPLFHVRNLDLVSRLKWFRGLTDDDLIYLNTYHFICMKHKAETQLAEICH
jgi:hypothetical protein